jgi:tight adherence protein B
VKSAEAAHLRIYSVGLKTRAYAASTLKSLATAAGGSYLTASKGAVTGLYGRLGTELSNQYLLRYRSTARLGSPVRVDVTVRGVGRAKLDYYAPALPAAAGDPPIKDTFWTSDAAIAVIVGLVALLVGIAVLVLRAPRASLRNRVGEFISLPSPDDDKAWASTLVERALGDARRRERRGFLSILVPSEEDLEQAGIGIPRSQVLLLTLGATVLMGFVFVALTGSIVGVLLAIVVPYVVRLAVRVSLDRQRRLFDSQLPDNLGVIASAMRAGHTFLGALGVVVADAPEPSRREFRRVLADEQLGVPLAEGLDAVAERMGSRDFEHVALVATLQSETGGNTAEVIDQVNETIRERQDLRRLVRTLTAQGRLAGFVVSGLPVALMGVIALVNPKYLSPMFHRPAGIFMLVVAGIMLVSGATIIKRIVDIDV